MGESVSNNLHVQSNNIRKEIEIIGDIISKLQARVRPYEFSNYKGQMYNSYDGPTVKNIKIKISELKTYVQNLESQNVEINATKLINVTNFLTRLKEKHSTIESLVRQGRLKGGT